MSKAATEINIASREQAQAFDQLGGHVMGIWTTGWSGWSALPRRTA